MANLNTWIDRVRIDRLSKRRKENIKLEEFLNFLEIEFKSEYGFKIGEKVFFVDFFIPETNSIIEIRKEKYDWRYSVFRKNGYNVARIENVDDESYVIKQLAYCLPKSVPAYMLIDL